MTVQQEIIQVIIQNFATYKSLAEKAFSQLDDAHFHYKPDPESNSIAIIIRHMAGNMHSRFTGFLTTDGEKPGRNRDSEFEDVPLTKTELLEIWQSGWQIVAETIQSLTPDELQKTVTIRQEPFSVISALIRQVSHYASHVGQIIMLAKHIKSTDWQTLSVPKGQSESYNQAMIEKLRSSKVS